MTGAVMPAHRAPRIAAEVGLPPESADAHRLTCRLHRIEGQIRGIQHMVETGRGCAEVLTQIAAVRGALDGFATQLVERDVRRCIRDATTETSPPSDAVVTEIATAISRLTRRP